MNTSFLGSTTKRGLLHVLVPPHVLIPGQNDDSEESPRKSNAKSAFDTFPIVPDLSEENKTLIFESDWEDVDLTGIMSAHGQEATKTSMWCNDEWYFLSKVFMYYSAQSDNLSGMSNPELVRFMKDIKVVGEENSNLLSTTFISTTFFNINQRARNAAIKKGRNASEAVADRFFDFKEFLVATVIFAVALHEKQQTEPEVAVRNFFASYIMPNIQSLYTRDAVPFRNLLRSIRAANGALCTVLRDNVDLLRGRFMNYSNADKTIGSGSDCAMAFRELELLAMDYELIDTSFNHRDLMTVYLLAKDENMLVKGNNVRLQYASFLEVLLRLACAKYGKSKGIALGLPASDPPEVLNLEEHASKLIACLRQNVHMGKLKN